MNNSKEFLGTEPIGKLLFKLAVPSVIAQIVNMLYNIVDRIYIGHIPGSGSLALTGVGVCLPIIMVVSAFAALVGSGGAPRASIFMGKDDMDSAEKILGGCFTVQIIISAILTAILLLFGRNDLCPDDAGHEHVHHGPGIFKDQYADSYHRRCLQHHSGSDLYLWAWHGRKGRSSCDDHLSGGVLQLGSYVPDRKEDIPADQKGELKAGSIYRSPVPGTGPLHICDAVQRERYLRML